MWKQALFTVLRATAICSISGNHYLFRHILQLSNFRIAHNSIMMAVISSNYLMLESAFVVITTHVYVLLRGNLCLYTKWLVSDYGDEGW